MRNDSEEIAALTKAQGDRAGTEVPKWYKGFIFKDESLVFELIRVMAKTVEHGADIGESLAAAVRIKQKEGDRQQLLDAWRTQDESIFRSAMQAAADFHVSRAKPSTGKTFYEFDTALDRLFPAELLAVQALRRRDGLPAFEAGHLLVDGPWAVIKDLPDAEPHPLTVRVEARLHRDYPDFR